MEKERVFSMGRSRSSVVDFTILSIRLVTEDVMVGKWWIFPSEASSEVRRSSKDSAIVSRVLTYNF